MIVRARCILPIGETPIDNGAMLIDGERIKWVGPWIQADRTEGGPVRDLGEVVLMPGLINAHCHLDFTHLAGKIPAPKDFPDWAKSILSAKAGWSQKEYVNSWRDGARMLVESGTTTVADTESLPEMLNETWAATPLRMISFLEMTNVKSQRPAREVLDEMTNTIESLPTVPHKEAGLSPHSLYSTTPELCRESAVLARKRRWLLSTHLSESESEFRMFMDRAGSLFEWLKDFRQMDDCGAISPVTLAKQYNLLGPDLLAIHLNYLAAGDSQILGETKTNVVHCPRSHAYFAHDAFPYHALKGAGANLCLGTDSLASSTLESGKELRLSLWDELREFSRMEPGVSPVEMFNLVTINPARALYKHGLIGQIRAGAFADLVALDYSGRVSERLICETLLHQSSVREVFISGELARKS